jgi:hypothetical protein
MKVPGQSQVLPNAKAGVLGCCLLKKQEVPKILKRTFDRGCFEAHCLGLHPESEIPKWFQLPNRVDHRYGIGF